MQENFGIEEKLLIEIIKISLKPSGMIKLSDGLDIHKIGQMIKKQHLELLVYPMLAKQADEKCLELAKKLEKGYHNQLFKTLVQENEIENLLNFMEKEKIDVLPLKGWVIRKYYPDTSMRIMTDFDVLLRTFDEEKVRKFMESIGYKAELTGDDHHDIYVKEKKLIVELHKRLSDQKIEIQKPKINQWLEEIWISCVRMDEKETTYELTKEDLYVYNLIHFYKHIRNSGAGIRSLIDVYVFLEKEKQTLDWEYIDNVLSELGLKKFEEFIRNLSRTCFGEEERLDTDQKAFLLMILSGGLFGSKKLSTSVKLIEKETGHYRTRKFMVLWKVIFQSGEVLKNRYTILKKHPWMLPAVWVYRIFRIVFCESWKISMISEGSKKKSYDEMSSIFKNAGIE